MWDEGVDKCKGELVMVRSSRVDSRLISCCRR